MRMQKKNNEAILRGLVQSLPQRSHEVHGIAFFRFNLAVPRLSGKDDSVNVLAPAPLLEQLPLCLGMQVEIIGEIRSFNNRSSSGSRLLITLFAQNLCKTSEDFCNQVFLRGVICKPPSLRRTPLGRDICDLLLAVNRSYHRADYLPCIAWGSLAIHLAQLCIGDTIILDGRLQSRQYVKAIGDTCVEHTAFEISIMSIEAADPT